MDKRKNRLIFDGDGDSIIPEQIYPVIDNDLARDNIENDLPDADLNELRGRDDIGKRR